MTGSPATTRRPGGVAPTALAALLGVLVWNTPAPAADEANSRRFTPSPVLSPYLTLDGTHTHGEGELAFHALGAIERRPLIFFEDGERTGDIVGSRLTLDTAIAYGVLEWLDLGVNLPLVLSQSGFTTDATAELSSFAIGDPSLAVKVRALDKQALGFGASLILSGTVPVGDGEALVGDPGFSGTGRLALEIPFGHRFDLALNGGYRYREPATIRQVTLEHELLLGAGLSYRISPSWIAVLEGNASTPTQRPFEFVAESPADVNTGLRWLMWRGVAALAGGGVGVQPGYGSPEWRLIFGLEIKPRRHDYDGDRVVDGTDRCITVPGVVAEQGCPAQRVAKRRPRRAPPPPTNDGDLDGILDAVDNCPFIPEDIDGFRDSDGCPDDDNDLDLLADVYDADPLGAEDWDGFEDEDGIPDLDNDRDGIADYVDRCPDVPGTKDGCSSEQVATDGRNGGIPSAARSGPVALGGFIYPARPIIFQFARAEPTQHSRPEIEALADLIKNDPSLGRVEVGVHTDSKGGFRAKQRLSDERAEALTRELIALGVPPDRLVSRGYGATVPIDRNDTREGRFRNRRVELRMLDRDIEVVLGTPENVGTTATGWAPVIIPPPRTDWLSPTDVVIRPDRPIQWVGRTARLTAASLNDVRTIAEILRARQDYRKVEIGVHTDGSGDLHFQQKISDQRAETIRKALVRAGIEPERLIPQGFGASRRLRGDDTAEDRAMNNRVEVVVVEFAAPQSMLGPGATR
jgi:outer membrane protein OmpA-like peptidoglycan-associated protein